MTRVAVDFCVFTCCVLPGRHSQCLRLPLDFYFWCFAWQSKSKIAYSWHLKTHSCTQPTNPPPPPLIMEPTLGETSQQQHPRNPAPLLWPCCSASLSLAHSCSLRTSPGACISAEIPWMCCVLLCSVIQLQPFHLEPCLADGSAPQFNILHLSLLNSSCLLLKEALKLSEPHCTGSDSEHRTVCLALRNHGLQEGRWHINKSDWGLS